MKLWMLYTSFNQYLNSTCTNNMIQYSLDAFFFVLTYNLYSAVGEYFFFKTELSIEDLWPRTRVSTRTSALLFFAHLAPDKTLFDNS